MKYSSQDLSAQVFVWGVWLLMFLSLLICLVAHGRNIPLSEDWFMVPPLTGNEPDLLGWLWQQNNEHRIPLPRFILLGFLKVTKGDFRSGMVLNVLAMATVTAAAILVARYIRDKKTSYADAFFPLSLLNLGDWGNFFWGWQFTFVLPASLTYALLFVFVVQPTLTSPVAAVIAGASLMLLPFCGANGLIVVPFGSAWLLYRGIKNWHSHAPGDNRSTPVFLIGSAIVALGLIGVYFISYQRPEWNPRATDWAAAAYTMLKFFAYSFGSVGWFSWSFFGAASLAVFFSCIWILLSVVSRGSGFDQQRALSLCLYWGLLLVFAVAIGYARGGSADFSIRYVIIAQTFLCFAFFTWAIYGRNKLGKFMQYVLFSAALILLPFNTYTGFYLLGDWYGQVMDAFERDVEAGKTITELSKNHRDLVHWFEEERLERHIQMLRQYRVGVFARIAEQHVNFDARSNCSP